MLMPLAAPSPFFATNVMAVTRTITTPRVERHSQVATAPQNRPRYLTLDVGVPKHPLRSASLVRFTVNRP